MTPEELYLKLNRRREFWFSWEIAQAFGVSRRTVQYCAKRKRLGRFVRKASGTLIFQKEDLPFLCQHIHGVAGNPIYIAMSKERKLNVSNDENN